MYQSNPSETSKKIKVARTTNKLTKRKIISDEALLKHKSKRDMLPNHQKIKRKTGQKRIRKGGLQKIRERKLQKNMKKNRKMSLGGF